MPRTIARRDDLDLLAARIEAALRSLLSRHRRRLVDPDIADAREEERELKRLQRPLERFEDVLKRRRPDEDEVGQFEDFLRHRQTALGDLEDKLHKRVNKEWPNHPSWSDDLIELVDGFEALLHGQEKLLRSFETLLHRFKTVPSPLVGSFEGLLRQYTALVQSFADILNVLIPSRGQIESLQQLLLGLADLLDSLEALVKSERPTLFSFAISFDDLLMEFDDLLKLFIMLVRGDIVQGRELEPEDEALLRCVETLLHRDAALLASLEGLVDEHGKAEPWFLGLFESRLDGFIERLDEFEHAIGEFAPKNRKLIKSFEDLLHELIDLLKAFAGLVKRDDAKNKDRLLSLESLLHGLGDRLESFENLVRNIPDEELVLSFEALVHGFVDLLELFRKLFRENAPGEEILAVSYRRLADTQQGLIGSLQDLKQRLERISEDLQRSDAEIIDGGLSELGALVAASATAPAAVAAALRMVATAQRLLLDFIAILGRERERRGRPVIDVGRLVSRQKRLVGSATALAARATPPSAFVDDAVADLAWLQAQTEERAAGLAERRTQGRRRR